MVRLGLVSLCWVRYIASSPTARCLVKFIYKVSLYNLAYVPFILSIQLDYCKFVFLRQSFSFLDSSGLLDDSASSFFCVCVVLFYFIIYFFSCFLNSLVTLGDFRKFAPHLCFPQTFNYDVPFSFP